MTTNFPGWCQCGHHRDRHLDVGHTGVTTTLTCCAVPLVAGADISDAKNRCPCPFFRPAATQQKRAA